MKFVAAIALASAVALSAAATPADARQGCGPGFHRGPYGHCRPNMGGRPVLVVGNFYDGRGYWDGHRYWHNRYRYHNGWRYR